MNISDIAKSIIRELSKLDGECVIVAIDGRCASGKTTLASELQALTGCAVIHTDDFYLPKEMRTDEIMSRPGGNIDFDRLVNEVLTPLKSGDAIAYRPYVCSKGGFGDTVTVTPQRLVILEGSYSCHPRLDGFARLSVFLDVDEDEQKRRINLRNGSAYETFATVWIPREESYFAICSVKDRCGLYFST